MMTSDVPTAVRIVNASAMASVGTMRNPPPTPKKPVTKPTAAPATNRAVAAGAGRRRRAPTAVPGLAVLGRAPGGVGRGEHDEREAGEQERAADRFGGQRAGGDAGDGGSGEPPGVAPAHAPGSGVAEAAGDCNCGHDEKRCGRGLGHGLVEDIDEDRHCEHGPAPAEGADGQPDGKPKRDGQQQGG